MARRNKKAEEEKRKELAFIVVAIIALVLFMSSFTTPTISGQSILSDFFAFLRGTPTGEEVVDQPTSVCENNEIDIGESDIDCGGGCALCEIGQKCNQNSDCSSQFCDSVLRVCAEPSCKDNIRNGGEIGIDCGGPCYPCHCYNGLLDENKMEERIDCSIANNICPLCDVDGNPPHCSDNIQSSGEMVGIDCGGSCAFLGRKNPQACYTLPQACNEAGFWWCDKQAKCFPGPVSECISTKEECETIIWDGKKIEFFWCESYSTCYDDVAYWCLTDKESCETQKADKELHWCDKSNYCIDYVYCDCYTNKKSCEVNPSCDWVLSGKNEQCITSSWLASIPTQE